ncbi:hypothetical protein Saro_0630 [Novosphingobium aromaticivorans DSM 12444]|uniref:Uncharacterized protein n=2 Tax=Novosphingobium aromaticivorans TaxID=48935 RepID=Q2GAP6_NOVAD|nr:hypothetical protein Saro_0630 [Novosphingobium aromaticivorans DSM 12444]SCY96123.1 hypothetical protein SAMN05660666_03904 [Novosphingobium aromaticivorans]
MLGNVTPAMKAADGLIGAWCTDADGVRDGFVMEPVCAITTGVKLIALASGELARASSEEGPPTIMNVPIDCWIADPVREDMAARLVFDFDGAPVAIGLDAHQLIKLAAALGALARKVG